MKIYDNLQMKYENILKIRVVVQKLLRQRSLISIRGREIRPSFRGMGLIFCDIIMRWGVQYFVGRLIHFPNPQHEKKIKNLLCTKYLLSLCHDYFTFIKDEAPKKKTSETCCFFSQKFEMEKDLYFGYEKKTKNFFYYSIFEVA